MARTLRNRLGDVRNNPALMRDLIFDELEAALQSTEGSYDVPDAGTPFVFQLESFVIGSTAMIDQQEAILRRLYPSMALTQEELYPHMADADYLGRFAGPVWSTFELYLLRNEITAKAVAYGDDGARKLVIPRRSSVSVADTTFTMQYPIEIRVMSHGGLQVVYDTDGSSPLQTLESNMVDWDALRIGGQDVIRLQIPMGQFAIQTFTETLNEATGFSATYAFSDYFYHARAYLSDGEGGWNEIHTTHTDQVLDPVTPTVVLEVYDGEVTAKVPLIYFSQGLMDGEIRLDIHTTQGPISVDLGDYEPGQYEMVLDDMDDDTTYVAPLNGFQRRQVINPNAVNGGSEPISFPNLRTRVIDNTLGVADVPITNAQLGTALENRGYNVITNIDNITNRQFLASRTLPSLESSAVSGSMGCVMGTVQTRLADITGSAHVKDNGERVTLLPSMLYQYVDGVIERVSDAAIAELNALTPDAMTRAVNQQRYLYTPFHYVLDASDENFDVRAYYLDAPSIKSKTFVGENESAGMQVSVDTYDFSRVAAGYQLTFTLKAGERFDAMADDDVIVQVGYQPVGENRYASVNATYLGRDNDQRVFRAVIETNLDVNADNHLRTTNLSMYDEVQRDFVTELDAPFDVTFILANQDLSEYRRGDLDDLITEHLLPDDVMVVARERFNLHLGSALDRLWRRNRTLVSTQEYQKYAADVPYVYEETVYERDENGTVPLELDDEGNITYPVKHRKGDPVLDADGNQRYRYRAGDVKLDVNNDPVPVSARKRLREYTLCLFDGVYYFVSDDNAIADRDGVPSLIVGWLENDVGVLQQRLLEQSELYLYPTTTFGDVTATVRQGLQTTVAVNQSLSVNYYVTESAYKNTDLRQTLETSTRDILVTMLGRTTITHSDIIARLKENAGDDVISIEVSGLGGESNYTTLSVQDDAVRLSLGKRLVVLANRLLAVEDDIDIAFLRHTPGG